MAKRILDEELEKDIRDTVDKNVKKAMGEVDVVKSTAMKELDKATRKAGREIDFAKIRFEDKTEETLEAIKEKPVEWVAGAFVAGLILGRLLSK